MRIITYQFDDLVSERAVARGLLRQTEPLKVRHRGGFSMLDMKRYAEERGYRATGFQKRRVRLQSHQCSGLPAIRSDGYRW